MRVLPVTAAVALAVLVAAAAGFLVGRGTGSDDNADKARDSARQASESRDAAVKSARTRATKTGYRRGLRVGRVRGVRTERRRAQQAATTPERPTSGATPTTGTTRAQVNPDCPPGTEPNTSGGCQPYDESNGQIEPKIDDPRCYSDRPPAGCF